VRCRRCPRLLAHCAHIAEIKRRAYRDQEYWGKPVPALATRQPAFSSWIGPRAHAPIARAECSPATVPETGSTAPCTRPAWPPSRQRLPRRWPATARRLHHCLAPVPPPDNKPTPQEIAIAGRIWNASWITRALAGGRGAGQDRFRQLPGPAQNARPNFQPLRFRVRHNANSAPPRGCRSC